MKKIIIAATLAALTVTSAAMAAPLRDPQPGDLKANANYGFDQKEGGRSAKSRLTGGDVTYVLNNHWDIQYVNNYTKGDNDNKINENYLVGNYRFTPYLSAYAGGSYVKTETYNTTKSYGYQVGLKGQLPLNAGRALPLSASAMTSTPMKSASATISRRTGMPISNTAAAASTSITTTTMSKAGKSAWAISSDIDNGRFRPV